MPVTICIPTLSDDFKPISEEKLLAQFESARKQRENNTALVTHKFPDTNRAPMEVADFIKSYKKD